MDCGLISQYAIWSPKPRAAISERIARSGPWATEWLLNVAQKPKSCHSKTSTSWAFHEFLSNIIFVKWLWEGTWLLKKSLVNQYIASCHLYQHFSQWPNVPPVGPQDISRDHKWKSILSWWCGNGEGKENDLKTGGQQGKKRKIRKQTKSEEGKVSKSSRNTDLAKTLLPNTLPFLYSSTNHIAFNYVFLSLCFANSVHPLWLSSNASYFTDFPKCSWTPRKLLLLILSHSIFSNCYKTQFSPTASVTS